MAGRCVRIKNGRRVRRNVSGRTESAVKDKLKALHEELDHGVKPAASYTVAMAVGDWLEQGLDGRSPKTLSTYRGVTAPLEIGHLLAQQLLSAGEQVLDVPLKLAARVRLLATGDTSKNDPNDARSVAVAALRSADVR